MKKKYFDNNVLKVRAIHSFESLQSIKFCNILKIPQNIFC